MMVYIRRKNAEQKGGAEATDSSVASQGPERRTGGEPESRTGEEELREADRTAHDHPAFQLQHEYGNRAVQRTLREPLPFESGAKRGSGDEGRHELVQPGTGTVNDLRHEVHRSTGSGQPLPTAVRSIFESRFVTDFNDVRIHQDDRAAALSSALGAHAFTYGQDIYFGQGNYQPKSHLGQQLLAHELAHTLQQQDSIASTLPEIVSIDSQSEYDAVNTTESVTVGVPTEPLTHLDVAAIQRSAETEELISSHTSWGNLDEAELGRVLLRRALAGEHAFVNQVLDALGSTNKDDVSYEFVSAASDAQLDTLADTETGRRFLDRIYDELTSGNLSDEEKAQADRVIQAKSRRITPEEFERGVQEAKIFPFKLPGITVFNDAPITAERRSGGRIWVNMPVRVLGTSAFRKETRTLPDEVFIGGIELPENEIIGVRMYDLGGEILYRPALFLVQLSNTTTTRALEAMAEAAGYGLSLGTAGLASGAATWGARALLSLERAAAAIGVLASVVNDHRGWIIQKFGESGRSFVRAVDIVNSVVSLYDMTTLAVSMGRTVNSLRRAYSEWRTARRSVQLTGEEADVSRQLTENTDELLDNIERARTDTTDRAPTTAGRGASPAEYSAAGDGPSLPPRESEIPPGGPIQPQHRGATAEGIGEDFHYEYHPPPERASEVEHVRRPSVEEVPASRGTASREALEPHPRTLTEDRGPDLELDSDYRGGGEPRDPNLIDLPDETGPFSVPGPRQRRRMFGGPSTMPGGTEARSGVNFRLYNAAEISPARLRIDHDPEAGRPRSVSFEVRAEAVQTAQSSQRRFRQDPTVEGAMSGPSGYSGSGQQRGHLAPRESFAGYGTEAEQASDFFTNIVPMTEDLNTGAWRAAEVRTNEWAVQYGTVSVEVRPQYEANPPSLSDGTPIPRGFERKVTTPDGTVLEHATYLNH